VQKSKTIKNIFENIKKGIKKRRIYAVLISSGKVRKMFIDNNIMTMSKNGKDLKSP
jgi:hypothetical protein